MIRVLPSKSDAAGDNAVQMVQALGILDGTNLTGSGEPGGVCQYAGGRLLLQGQHQR